jgi:hypothetical protein
MGIGLIGGDYVSPFDNMGSFFYPWHKADQITHAAKMQVFKFKLPDDLFWLHPPVNM